MCPKDLGKRHRLGEHPPYGSTRLGGLKSCRVEGLVHSKAGKQEREQDGVKHEEARDMPQGIRIIVDASSVLTMCKQHSKTLAQMDLLVSSICLGKLVMLTTGPFSGVDH